MLVNFRKTLQTTTIMAKVDANSQVHQAGAREAVYGTLNVLAENREVTKSETPWILTVDGNERICDVCFKYPSALLFSEMAVKFLPTVRTHR